ncbi:hypothetical protein B4144_0839 [Bacillus atrophaeus]|nr:hypothetical protein B4144_0839 [Bacillus atrophaeus]
MKIIEDKNGRIEACKYMEDDLSFLFTSVNRSVLFQNQ